MKKIILTISAALIMQVMAFAQIQEELFTSCLKCDFEGVKKAVENGADVNEPNAKTKQNTLAYAYFSPEITRYLLEKKCDPNGGAYPAILGAASVGSYEVMQLLLENGADPNKSAYNMNALIQVVKMTNSAECADLLLSKGADKNAKESVYGNAFGVYAANALPQAERKEAMKKYGDILKGYGLNVPEWYYNPSVKLNGTPDEMVKVLVKHGVDINKRGTNLTDPSKPGEPPLFTAMNVGKEEVILSFLNNGADYNVKHNVIEKGFTYWNASDGYTPLMYACVKKYSNIVKWLASKSDIVNHSVSGQTISSEDMIYNFSGLSAIFIAIMQDDITSVQALAESKIKWEDFVLESLPGQKFESSYGSKPSGKIYNFGTIGGSSSGEGTLKYTPSLYADLLEQKEMADYLRSKGL